MTPIFIREVFIFKNGSFWHIGRGCYEDGNFAYIKSTGYTLKEQAIIDAKAYANYWGDKYIGVKGE